MKTDGCKMTLNCIINKARGDANITDAFLKTKNI